jgi:hypothetical protein
MNGNGPIQAIERRLSESAIIPSVPEGKASWKDQMPSLHQCSTTTSVHIEGRCPIAYRFNQATFIMAAIDDHRQLIGREPLKKVAPGLAHV